MRCLPDHIIEVKIPVELAKYAVWQRKLVTKYETNQVIKALDTWLILKALTRSSLIQNWNKQKAHLLAVCKVSESIFRHRLKQLAKMQLVTADRQNIRLCSWEQLATALDIDIKEKKIPLPYDTTNTQKISQWLIASEIAENQERQDYMILKNLNKIPERMTAVTAALLAFGADQARLKEPGYLLSMLRALYLHDFQQATDIHDLLVEVRPDNNRGIKGMADAWKCKHPSTVSYWKKSLSKAHIIDVQKLQVQSMERVRNSQCKVLWLKDCKQTLLCLPDLITVLKPQPGAANLFLSPAA